MENELQGITGRLPHFSPPKDVFIEFKTSFHNFLSVICISSHEFWSNLRDNAAAPIKVNATYKEIFF